MANSESVRSTWRKKPLEILSEQILSISETLGIEWLGFKTDYKNAQSRILLNCSLHGIWDISINQFLTHETGCRACSCSKKSQHQKFPDQHFIDQFTATEKYAAGSQFKRLSERDKNKVPCFWEVHCSFCKEVNVCRTSNLLQGKVSCLCARTFEQDKAYILKISENGIDLALKFGISSEPASRYKKIQYRMNNCYKLEILSVFIFDDFKSCRQAENACKVELHTSIFDKQLMPDGYTETTWCYNLDNIESIYRRHGGVEIEVNNG